MGRKWISCCADERRSCTEQGLSPRGSGTLVPNGWGWEGALGSFLRHGTPPSPSAWRVYHSRRARLPIPDQLIASLPITYHSKGGDSGEEIPSAGDTRAGKMERQGTVPQCSISCSNDPGPPCPCSQGMMSAGCSHLALQGTFTPSPTTQGQGCSPQRWWVRTV